MNEFVPIPSPGTPLLFGEEGAPLIVLLHDWYGRLPWLEFYAEALARIGFRVSVPDLYDGVATTDAATAEQLFDGLDLRRALAIIDDTIDTEREAGSARVGLVGFSLGGWIALLHAQGGAAEAVVAYYATVGQDQHGVIPCPVMLHLAEDDEFEPAEQVEAFVGRLKDHGTPVTQWSYLGTQHGFANATAKEALNRDAAALAYARSASFLEQHLHG
jgi:carboxymethylenebutenolidase